MYCVSLFGCERRHQKKGVFLAESVEIQSRMKFALYRAAALTSEIHLALWSKHKNVKHWHSLLSHLSSPELLTGEDAGHHVSGVAGGQVIRLSGGILTTLPPHHLSLRRGGYWDAKHSAALTGAKQSMQLHTHAHTATVLYHIADIDHIVARVFVCVLRWMSFSETWTVSCQTQWRWGSSRRTLRCSWTSCTGKKKNGCLLIVFVRLQCLPLNVYHSLLLSCSHHCGFSLCCAAGSYFSVVWAVLPLFAALTMVTMW